MTYTYSFEINYRVRPNSDREQKLLELSKEYKLEPGCRLIDRILEDRYIIMQDRAVGKAEALRKIEDAQKELRRLAAGT